MTDITSLQSQTLSGDLNKSFRSFDGKQILPGTDGHTTVVAAEAAKKKRAPILIHEDGYIREANKQSLETLNVKQYQDLLNKRGLKNPGNLK